MLLLYRRTVCLFLERYWVSVKNLNLTGGLINLIFGVTRPPVKSVSFLRSPIKLLGMSKSFSWQSCDNFAVAKAGVAVQIKSSILLSVCLVSFASIGSVFAGEVNPACKLKLSASPVDFKVEEHKAEQKLVFKLGLPVGAPPEIIQKASKSMLNTFHQWGASVEKACANLDRSLRATSESVLTKAQEFSPKHATNSAANAGEHGAKVALSRAKAVVER
ncbi:MAG: hypothetical protein C5B53_04030 [Candidatus Melainabacteria bacterium]|nr:MAG: hypothetical protein C5B53_04030 [Candidatus Melainabacteria bacterium]